jgi:hypothetical protein
MTRLLVRWFITVKQSNARHHPPARKIDLHEGYRVAGRVQAVVGRRVEISTHFYSLAFFMPTTYFTAAHSHRPFGGASLHMTCAKTLHRISLALALLGFCFGACRPASPGEQSFKAYKENVPKFEALLPQWSKLVGAAEEKNFQERPVAPVKGKVIFVGREYTTTLPKVDPVTLHFKNENRDLHEAGLIASSPEEAGALVFVHTLIDQTKLYEGGATYTAYKFRVYVVDPASAEVRGSTELKVDKYNPPSSVKGTGVSLYPYDKLDKFIESLASRKD